MEYITKDTHLDFSTDDGVTYKKRLKRLRTKTKSVIIGNLFLLKTSITMNRAGTKASISLMPMSFKSSLNNPGRSPRRSIRHSTSSPITAAFKQDPLLEQECSPRTNSPAA